jgi:hypothetical protein
MPEIAVQIAPISPPGGAVWNPISRIDPPFGYTLSAVGPGSMFEFSQPQRSVSMQVSYTGAPTAVKANLEGSNDGVNWFALSVFDTTAGGVNGGIVGSTSYSVLFVRANLLTLTAGTSPVVSFTIQAAAN